MQKGQDVSHSLRFKNLLPSDRSHPSIGQGPSHHSHCLTGDLWGDRAVMMFPSLSLTSMLQHWYHRSRQSLILVFSGKHLCSCAESADCD